MHIWNNDNRIYRKMGFFNDQSGIMKRYRREKDHWSPHLLNTRQFILQSMQGKKKGSAAILGSGWLLDVPLKELCGSFGQVFLFDICHPNDTRKQTREFRNVQYRTCDISGYALPVYHYIHKKEKYPLTGLYPQGLPELDMFDFVVSCNILNQLDILLADYIMEHISPGDKEITAFRKMIQQRHIALLPPSRSCLVFDYQEITYDINNKELSRDVSVFDDIIHRPDATRWTWEFDTRMTYYPGRKTFFEVLAVDL